MPAEHVCIEHFIKWLRGRMTGCMFSSKFAAAGRINYGHQLNELNRDAVAGLEAFIDTSGAANRFAVVLFPRLRTARGIGRMLQTLATRERWRASRLEWRHHPREGAALVGLRYRTVHGEESSVMGFAPLGCMPVTRRAPYVALAAWGGGKLNKHKNSPAGEVGFIDAPTFDANGEQVSAEAHEKTWTDTRASIKQLLGDPPEDGWRLKDAAFCLPEAVVAEFVAPAVAL